MPGLIRVAAVHTPKSSGLFDRLLPEFEAASGYKVTADERSDVYSAAQNGGYDLIISHYGHKEATTFMSADLGLRPHPIFANQAALLGPPGDPAHVRGLADAVDAFRRIAETKSLFLLNNSAAEKYLATILWEAAGRPDKSDWFEDSGEREQPVIEHAARMGAYTLWGIVPFLKLREREPALDLDALVLGDPLFQRMMVSVVVNPDRIRGVNVAGARALEAFLVSPRTQAAIRAFRYPGLGAQIWWPQGRNNEGAFLGTPE